MTGYETEAISEAISIICIICWQNKCILRLYQIILIVAVVDLNILHFLTSSTEGFVVKCA